MKVEKEKAGGLERNQGNCFPMHPSFFFPPLYVCLMPRLLNFIRSTLRANFKLLDQPLEFPQQMCQIFYYLTVTIMEKNYSNHNSHEREHGMSLIHMSQEIFFFGCNTWHLA